MIGEEIACLTFGSYTADVRASDTELFMFLTPRVLRNDTEVDGLTRQYRQPGQ
jgi:type II secretory pathway component GspD/PulD (secretin)